MAALPVMALVASAAGTGLSVASGLQQGKAYERQAAHNAKVQKLQARTTREDQAENARRKRSDNRRELARLRASYAGKGLVESVGAPLDIYGDTASRLELAVQDAGVAAERRAQALESGADMSLFEGDNRATGARMGALSRGLAGVGNLASSGYQAFDKLEWNKALSPQKSGY